MRPQPESAARYRQPGPTAAQHGKTRVDGLKALFGDQVISAPPILLCQSPARFQLRRLLEPFLPKVIVLAPAEIPPFTPVQSIGALR